MKQILRASSIQGRLGAIVFSILLLLIISVGLTFWGLENQDQDAHLINLAGRQRMLAQQMSGLMVGTDLAAETDDAQALSQAVQTYDDTLSVLQFGGTITDYSGQVLQLEPPNDLVVQAELNALSEDWAEFKIFVDAVLQNGKTAPNSVDAVKIQQSSQMLTDQADRVVTAYESLSSRKLSRLITIQITFLATGLVLLAIGWWLSYRTIVLPLRKLEQSAAKIGSGDLITEVEIAGPDETRVLAAAMEDMRSQLVLSRQELENWANQLENRVKQRTRELEALSVVGLEISSHLDLREVLQSVTEKAQLLLGSEVASLCLLDYQGTVLQLQSVKGPKESILRRASPVTGTGAELVLNKNHAQACTPENCTNFCAILHPAYRASHIAASLQSNGRVIGALCVGSSHPDAFSQESGTILTQLANAAAGALENSRLYEQAEHAAMLEERQRIASDMHDGLLQTLSFLQWMVRIAREQLANYDVDQAVSTLGQIERANSQADGEIRQAVVSLQEELPQHSTLQKQLEDLARLTADSKVPIMFNDCVLLPLVLNHQMSEQVLRVVREAVMNAQRYSRAEEIVIHLEHLNGNLSIEVEDDGVGFSPFVDPGDGRPHFGLKIMRARAARLNGQLDISSTPGRGTRVRLTWPYPIEDHASLGSIK